MNPNSFDCKGVNVVDFVFFNSFPFSVCQGSRKRVLIELTDGLEIPAALIVLCNTLFKISSVLAS